ncbi:MAG: metallophosphoesterase family protein [bacterium]
MPKWNLDYDSRRRELIQNYTYDEVAEIMTEEFGEKFTSESIRCRCKTFNETKNKHKFSNTGKETLNTFKKESIRKKVNKKYLDLPHPVKILVLSDIHIPYHKSKMIENIIEKEEADIVVLAGDILDLGFASSFKVTKDLNFKMESNPATELLEMLDTKYEKIFWLKGNHEARIDNFISDIDSGFKEFAKERLDILSYFEEMYEDLIVIDDYYLKLGNVLISHPRTKGAVVPCKPLIQMHEHFTAIQEKFDILIMGHTHYNSIVKHNGKLLVETGCLCYEPDYRHEGRPIRRAWSNGYVIYETNDKGITDINSIKLVHL